MAFRNLSARISGDSSSYVSATEAAKGAASRFGEETASLAARLQVMQGRADEAESEVDSLGRSAVSSAGSMSALSLSTEGASLSFSRLSGVMIGTLIPALFTLSAALAPVLAALGGLAAIGGTLGGLGLIGAIGGVATNLEQFKNAFSGLVDTIRTEFAPVFDIFGDTLLVLLHNFQQIVPELVPAEDVMHDLANAMRQIGNAVIDALPAVVDWAESITSEFLPAATDLAEDVLPAIPGLVETMVDAFRELAPTFQRVGQFLAEFGPAFLDFGFAALNVVGPAMQRLGDITVTLLRHFNRLEGGLQDILTSASLLTPIVLGLVSLLGGPLTLALAAVAGAVFGLWKVWDTNFANIQGVVEDWVSALRPLLGAARQAFNDFMEGVDFEAIWQSIQELGDTIEEYLTKNLEAAKPLLGDIEDLLKNNEEEFRTLGRAVGWIVENLIGFAQTVLKVVGPVLRNVVIPLMRALVSVIDDGLTRLSNLIKMLGALKGGEIDRAATLAQNVVLGEERTIASVTQPQRQQVERTSERVVERIGRITVEDGEIVAMMDDRVDRKSQQWNDEADRLGGRGG